MTRITKQKKLCVLRETKTSFILTLSDRDQLPTTTSTPPSYTFLTRLPVCVCILVYFTFFVPLLLPQMQIKPSLFCMNMYIHFLTFDDSIKWGSAGKGKRRRRKTTKKNDESWLLWMGAFFLHNNVCLLVHSLCCCVCIHRKKNNDIKRHKISAHCVVFFELNEFPWARKCF